MPRFSLKFPLHIVGECIGSLQMGMQSIERGRSDSMKRYSVWILAMGIVSCAMAISPMEVNWTEASQVAKKDPFQLLRQATKALEAADYAMSTNWVDHVISIRCLTPE